MQHRCTNFEALEDRQMLTSSSDTVSLVPKVATVAQPTEVEAAFAPRLLGQAKGAREGAEPQYRVHQTPRIQLGNAPLASQAGGSNPSSQPGSRRPSITMPPSASIPVHGAP